jgi:hypothetical protein
VGPIFILDITVNRKNQLSCDGKNCMLQQFASNFKTKSHELVCVALLGTM